MAKGFFSPKLTLHVGDGFEFMKKNQDAFDIIITDSSDPVGGWQLFHLSLFTFRFGDYTLILSLVLLCYRTCWESV